MPDYNIYLHTDTTTTSDSPTKPKSTRADKPTSTKASQEKESNMLKTAVGVGVGFAVAKVSTKFVKQAIDTGVSFYTSITGDFRVSSTWNSVSNAIDVITKLADPTSLPTMVISGIRNQINNQKQMIKAQEQAKLTGDSIVNYYTNLGV